MASAKVRKFVIAAMSLPLAMLVACGGSDDDGSITLGDDGVLSEEVTVKVAVSSKALAVMPPWVATVWPEFKERNITIVPESVDAGNSLTLLSTGKIDARISGPTAGEFNAISDGLDVRTVAPGPIPTAETGSGIYVSKAALDGKEFEPSMLKGQKIASSQGSTGMSAVQLAHLLEEGGLTPDDVEVVTMPTADQPIALENGSIFAGIILEPLNVPLETADSAIKVSPQLLEGWPNSTIEFGPSLLRDNPDVGKAFVAALREMYANHLQGDYLSDDRVDIISKALDQPVDILQKSTADNYQTTLSFPDDFVQELEKTWRLWPDQLKSDEAFETSDVIDTRFLEYANSQQ